MVCSTNVLVALELIREIDDRIMNKTLDVIKKQSVNLHLVHVVETVGEYELVSPQTLLEDIEKREANAKKNIYELGSLFEVPEENRFVIVGLVKEAIVNLIQRVDADLLVVGNHSRHGFDTWFHWNNTVSLLKHTACDVLAVRVS